MQNSSLKENVTPSELESIYISGQYLEWHPDWHVEESAWKAGQIQRMLISHQLEPQTIVEVGCGFGKILWELQQRLGGTCSLHGYDISPQAITKARQCENDRLHFTLGDIRGEANQKADLLLIMDVLEHIEDRFGFLRDLRARAEYKIFHVSLTVSIQTVLRSRGLAKVRDTYGMVNYYTKETLLQNLLDAGYEIVDYCYTTSGTDLPSKEIARNLMRYPRKALFALNKDLTARVLGGYRLLILAR